jgi:outer membrane protein assembly factor BamE (lipoprotein component of BamABCDE complex)
MSKIFLYAILMFFLTACSRSSHKYGTERSTQLSNLTIANVKKHIQKGKTNQGDILKTFGNPNLVSKNRSSQEVWSYNRMSYESRAGNSEFFDGQRASHISRSKSFDLIITFDDNDVVIDYSVVSSAF